MRGRYESWGRYPKTKQRIIPLGWRHENPLAGLARPVLPYGQGRSYGDCCLNDGGALLTTERLDRFISFNQETGLLRCESGVTLAQILEFAVPRGWFLPVTPGTKFVSVGGAIANDVHGKNHHRAGCFGNHVPRFELLRSDGTRRCCSLKEHPALYRATIGGLGLTGLIVWADVQLHKVLNGLIDMESIKFGSLDEFFALSGASDQQFEYTVAWLDCVAAGRSFGRGIFMRGNHSQEPASHPERSEGARHRQPRRRKRVVVPFDLPGFALNHWSVKAFNTVWYGKQLSKEKRSRVSYDPFFYPLDMVDDSL